MQSEVLFDQIMGRLAGMPQAKAEKIKAGMRSYLAEHEVRSAAVTKEIGRAHV